MTVVSGTASTQSRGSQLNVTTSPFTVLNWNSFNIQAGETTTFLQPSVNSVVFNNIGGASASQIWGNLTANGTVILANASGISFGPNSFIKIGGSFVATTAVMPQDFGPGAAWQFNGPPPLARIVNYGRIEVGAGHSLYLIAEQIDNQGSLSAPAGDVGLYAGQNVLLSERPDGRGISANVQLPAGSIDNSGRITADAGVIALSARVVNQDGIIQANSVVNNHGDITLVATDAVNLGANSAISAQGDAAAVSSGGSVRIQSGDAYSDAVGSTISVAGGARGGNGGSVTIIAPNMSALNSAIDGHAAAGSTGGTLFLDPYDINIGASGSDSAGTGTVTAGSSAGSTLNLNVNSAFIGLSQIDLQADHSINLAAGVTWNLAQSTGQSGPGCQLTLEAGNLLPTVNASGQVTDAGSQIVFGSGSSILGGAGWSVTLQAGRDFTSSTAITPGAGNILLNGNSFLQTQDGNITVAAGESVTVNAGEINTLKGGSIFVQAISGDVNAGYNNLGYIFSNSGYNPGGTLGGISTAHGGNVTLEAGDDVISVPNGSSLAQNQGASGAYGTGNVTVVVGNQILGNYLVRNGTGLLEAGVTVQNSAVTDILNPAAAIGSASLGVTLSLVSGNWEAFAAGDLYVNEVLNPNGTFNSLRRPVPSGTFVGNISASGLTTAAPSLQAFLFDYAPNAGASFWAGNSITLGGANLTRINSGGTSDVGMPPVYPPQLSLEAGAGGITVENSIVLYPSSQGMLNITTVGGGNLNGVFTPLGGGLSGITMSDSGLPDYQTFATGHATTPLHLNDPNLVNVSISGGIDNFDLSVPTAAAITAGNTYNFAFSGQNLSSTATTLIEVTGSISYRGDLTSVTLPDPLPASLLQNTPEIRYDPSTSTLVAEGQMSVGTEAELLNLATSPFYNPAIVLTAAQQAAVTQLYTASQTASLADSDALSLFGPGHFNINAGAMDLGISGGIILNQVPLPALTAISPRGAALTVTLNGNLEMSLTQIANDGLAGGIDLNVAGAIDVGSQSGVFGTPNSVRGIFTSGGGDISVTAGGNINVDGSRIATFAGGNITVKSLSGDVNAGSGGNGQVGLDSAVQLGPDGTLEQILQDGAPPTIYGSGIMALTLKESTVPVGNITVEAPHGSINADAGGIEQVAFNNNVPKTAFIELDAGKDISAGDSGVIGSNIRVQAGGDISGIFVGTGTINIQAANNFSGTVIGSGAISVNAGNSISGTIVGGGSVNVSGQAITADLVSSSVSTSGDISGATQGVSTANAPKENFKAPDDTSTADGNAGDSATGDSATDNNKKKNSKTITLAQKSSRVTVILPGKK